MSYHKKCLKMFKIYKKNVNIFYQNKIFNNNKKNINNKK